MFLNHLNSIMQYIIASFALFFIIIKIKELVIKAIKAELRACNLTTKGSKQK